MSLYTVIKAYHLYLFLVWRYQIENCVCLLKFVLGSCPSNPNPQWTVSSIFSQDKPITIASLTCKTCLRKEACYCWAMFRIDEAKQWPSSINSRQTSRCYLKFRIIPSKWSLMEAQEWQSHFNWCFSFPTIGSTCRKFWSLNQDQWERMSLSFGDVLFVMLTLDGILQTLSQRAEDWWRGQRNGAKLKWEA